MHIVTNETLVKRNRKIATSLFFFSMIVLGVGFFAANGSFFGISAFRSLNQGVYFMCMPVVLLIGFVSTLISVRMTNLWLRVPRPEDVIKENLKGLSHKSALYNYYHSPARHVLICPQGVFVIVTRYQDGKYSVNGDKWKTRRSLSGKLFSAFRLDDLGDPTREAKDAAAYVHYITEDYDPDLVIQPLILFINPRAQLEINESTVPVLFADPKIKPNLKEYLRDLQKPGTTTGLPNIEEFIKEFEAATLEYD